MRELEVFLMLAEELHFGRAAERLYVTQPRVSQAVRSLEQRIGGPLFHRTSRRVSLTPLGVKLLSELRPGYEQIKLAVSSATDLAKGINGTLRVCVPTYPMAGPHFGDIVRTFQADHLACRVVTTEEFPGDFAQLRRGIYDVMCHRLPITEPDLVVGPTLTIEDRVLLVPAGSPLAARGYATLEDLGDYALIARSGIPTSLYDEMFPTTTPAGRPIRRGPEITTSSDLLHLVAQGEIVHPTVASFYDYYRHPEVVPVPLHGTPRVHSVLVRVAGPENAAVLAFFEVAAAIYDTTLDGITD